MKRLAYNITIAFEAILMHRLRSFLTALGIIFGVAAVIAMMAIGSGARQEILAQIRLVGLNNIIISPVRPDDGGEDAGGETSQGPERYSPGLRVSDALAMRSVIPGVDRLSSQIVYDMELVADGRRMQARLSGVDPSYFSIFNLSLEQGAYFENTAVTQALPVCVIGAEVRARLFPDTDPLGSVLKAGSVWLRVIGVLERSPAPAGLSEMGIEDHNRMVYTTVPVVLLRVRDRAAITAGKLRGGEEEAVVILGEGEATNVAEEGGHQVDRIILQVSSSGYLQPAAEVIRRMLTRRHNGVVDFKVGIPEMLLKQEQRTREVFNIVLGAIAGIALLVGGIGIMNIMLASVLERIREIGVRQAMGARRGDIVTQFLAESTLISIGGGLLGVLLGVAMSKAITAVADVPTLISAWSIFLSFMVAASVGILFGIVPARRASRQDPVISLRYE